MALSKPTNGKFLVLAAYSNRYNWNSMSNSYIFLNNPNTQQFKLYTSNSLSAPTNDLLSKQVPK